MKNKFADVTKADSGFTLVEILVSLGIVSIMGAVILSLMEFSVKGNSMQKFSSQATNFDAETRALLSSPIACAKSLSAIDLSTAASDSVPVTQLKGDDDKVMVELNVPYGDRSFTVASMSLSQYTDTINLAGRAVFTVVLNSTVDTLGPKTLHRTINIETTKGPAGKLVKCVALAGMTDGIWQYQPNTSYNAFFVGGNIGINTAQPRATLQVAGKIQGRPDCREVEVAGGSPNYISIAYCDKGDYLLTGGGLCSNLGSNGLGNPGEVGFLHANFKLTGQEGWVVDCYDPVHGKDVASKAEIVCCNDGT